MKRTVKKLALLAIVACLALGIGEVRRSCAFAGSMAWVAGVDSQTGLLPVFAGPSDESVIVGSLHRCTKVTLTGNEQDSWGRDLYSDDGLGAVKSAHSACFSVFTKIRSHRV